MLAIPQNELRHAVWVTVNRAETTKSPLKAEALADEKVIWEELGDIPVPEFKTLLQNNIDVFRAPTSGPTSTRAIFQIKLYDDAGPKWNHRPWRTSIFEDEEILRQTTIALEKGWISPSNPEFASPVLFVPKKDGKLRMCIDYRRLNEMTVKDRYAIPNIEDLLHRLRGAS